MVRRPASVSTATDVVAVSILPAASVAVAVIVAVYVPAATLPAANVAVQLPLAETTAVAVAPPSSTVTVEPGSVMPETVRGWPASSALITPSAPPVVDVIEKSRTNVSTSNVPVDVAVLPKPSVATAVTVPVYSPSVSCVEEKDELHEPSAPATTVCVTLPMVTSTDAPGWAVPVKATPPSYSAPLIVPSLPTVDVLIATDVTVSTTKVSVNVAEFPKPSVATAVMPVVYSPPGNVPAGYVTVHVPSDPITVVSVLPSIVTASVAPASPVPLMLTS